MQKYLVQIVIFSLLLPLGVGCKSEAQKPVISEINADKEWVKLSGTIYLAVDVLTGDSNSLMFDWSASGGELSNNGRSVSWKAPDSPGAYKIMVSVSNNTDLKVMKQKTVYVGENHEPVIQSLTPEYIKIEKAQTCHLLSDVYDSDGDALRYEWKANRGSISRSGPEARWVSPNTYVSAIITLEVTDGRGGRAVKKVIIPVVCCNEAVKNPDWPL
jgi:hypothetical protein